MQGINKIICREKEMKRMERPGNDNASMKEQSLTKNYYL